MGEADVDPTSLGVQSDTFDPPGPLQGQESGEEVDVAHGRVTVRLAMGGRTMGPGGYSPGEIPKREEGAEGARREPARRVAEREPRRE
jgi:hypothetical protein